MPKNTPTDDPKCKNCGHPMSNHHRGGACVYIELSNDGDINICDCSNFKKSSPSPTTILRGLVSITDLEILMLLNARPKTVEEVSALLQVSHTSSRVYIHRLRMNGFVTSIKRDGVLYYTLTGEGTDLMRQVRERIGK